MRSAGDPTISSTEEVSGSCERPPMCHRGIVSVVLAFWLLVATASNALASNIAEKKFPFPSPIQWKKGKAEISLIALAWGPANSPEMISKGRERQRSEKPEFFSGPPMSNLALSL